MEVSLRLVSDLGSTMSSCGEMRQFVDCRRIMEAALVRKVVRFHAYRSTRLYLQTVVVVAITGVPSDPRGELRASRFTIAHGGAAA